MTDLIHNWVNQHRRAHNYMAAVRELNLTPQERYAYQHHLRNLDRGGVPHSNGSLSSFLNLTFDYNDRTYLIPSVWDNRIVSNDEAWQRAMMSGIQNWPSYANEGAAKARYDAIHRYMERDTDRVLNAHPIQQPAGTNDPGAMDQRPQPTSPTRQYR